MEEEYKEFVKKAIELDPNPMWLPGESHSYVSKRAFKEAVWVWRVDYMDRSVLERMGIVRCN